MSSFAKIAPAIHNSHSLGQIYSLQGVALRHKTMRPEDRGGLFRSFASSNMSQQTLSPTPTLYLIPVPLAEVEHSTCLPEYNREVIASLRHFIVEQVRTARRFLKATCPEININELQFYELNKHTPPEAIASYLDPMKQGHSIGIISEAGCPAVADPGSDVVAIAQRSQYRVEPLVGPSSILMALMASGMSGQRFAFLGYLPIDERERQRAIREAEQRALTLGETQIFIETPYRNDKLASELTRLCRPTTRLCIGCEISAPDGRILTRTIAQWRGKLPSLHKRPTIFLLGR